MNIFTQMALNELRDYGLECIHPILHVRERKSTILLKPVTLTLPITRGYRRGLKTFVLFADNCKLTDVTNTATIKVEGDQIAIKLKQLNVYVISYIVPISDCYITIL